MKTEDQKHLMSWLMFLLVWLIFMKVYEGYWLLDIIKWFITGIFIVFFLRDVRRYL